MSELRDLAKVFVQISDLATMERFFKEIFTEAEQKDFTLRWQLMKMLDKKIPQREIASRLGISLCKITRGVKILQNSQSVSRKFVKSENQ